MDKLLPIEEKLPLVIAGTGHRPGRLQLAYDAESNQILTTFAKYTIKRVIDEGFQVKEVISGFALGWDSAMAHAAMLLDIPVIAAIPFPEQDSKWSERDRKRYHAMLKRAKEVHTICPSYSKQAFIERDHWMVDRAANADQTTDALGVLFALWDGHQYGGTWETVSYAESKKLKVINFWRAWDKMLDGVSTSGQPRGDANDRVPSVGRATRQGKK